MNNANEWFPESENHHESGDLTNGGPPEWFVREITSCQGRLYAFILTLLPDLDAANDVLQETNLVIWRKWRQFSKDTGFHAWVCRIAHYEVLAYRRNRARDRHLFDEALVADVARAATLKTTEGCYELALRRCLEKLGSPQRELIRQRYGKRASMTAIADATGSTAQSLASKLYRIRQSLQNCVNRVIAAQ